MFNPFVFTNPDGSRINQRNTGTFTQTTCFQEYSHWHNGRLHQFSKAVIELRFTGRLAEDDSKYTVNNHITNN